MNDYAKRVPRDYRANLEYRLKILKRANGDVGFQKAMIDACSEDFIFMLTAMCWIFEPRIRVDENGKRKPNVIPFITWPHQERVFRQVDESLGVRDIAVLKSRAEGASWMGVYFAVRDFLFRPMSNVGLISKDRDSVDTPGNMDSLMAKIDFALKKLPVWMTGTLGTDYIRNRADSTLLNNRNGSMISGFSATGEAATGSRKTWMLAQPVSEPVLTPSGYVQIGILKVGDKVIGRSGLPVTVTAVHDHGIRPVRRVTFDDGAWTRCCDDHLWPVCTTGNRHCKYTCLHQRKAKWGDTPYTERYVRLPLKEIRTHYLYPKGKWVTKKYHIPLISSPIQYEDVGELPLPPYLVGAWIGDGYSNEGHVPCYASDDQEIVYRVESELPAGCALRKQRHQVYSVTRTGTGTNPFMDVLRSLDMLRVGVNKRIPEVYMRSGPIERLELIRGLMDTDGHIRKQKNKLLSSNTQFTSISPTLAGQFAELVCSLGGTCRVRRRKTVCHKPGGVKVSGKDAYICFPVMPDGMNPFWLARKADRFCDRTTYGATRLIADIMDDGEEECRCITVDAEDHFYLTRGMIVTSNCDEISKFPVGQDEELMTSTRDVTDSRLIVATPKGSANAYYKIMHEDVSEDAMLKVTLSWRENPTKNRGLYQMQGGVPVAISADNPLLPEYNPPTPKIISMFSLLRQRGFNLEKQTRSAWYDKQCARPRATPQSIAQELDFDFGGSVFHYFGEDFMKVVHATERPPRHEGNFAVHAEELEGQFDTVAGGPLRLWTELNTYGEPPVASYALGADIAAGLGGDYSSNSVLCVFNLNTHEQVAEFVVNTMSPSDFADLSIAIAKWFYDGFLCWEANGSTGTEYGKRIMLNRYPHIYYRRVTWKRGNKKTKEPGFWNAGDKGRGILFGDMQRTLRSQEFTIRSKALVAEFPKYIFDGGVIVHETSRHSENESAKGLAHGDRVIACGCALQAAQEKLGNKKYKPLEERDQHEELDEIDKILAKPEKEDDEWDERSAIDLVKRR